MIEIQITNDLTRNERIVLCDKAVREAELHGFAEIKIIVHNHQITDLSLNKANRFGNCSEEWYANIAG